MNPLSNFTRVVARYRPDPRFYPRTALYFVKLAAWEPFRWLERLFREPVPDSLPHPPVIILGYYRSGTTHLQEVLLQDDRFGYLTFYQGFFPTAFNSTEWFVRPVFDAILRAVGFLHPAHGKQLTLDLPAEDDVALVTSGTEVAANWGQVFPKSFKDIHTRYGFMDGLSDEELARFKAELHDILWRSSRAAGHKRMLLKSPPHTGRLATLHAMYPDARFIFIRRNPYDVFMSNLKLWKSFEGQHLQAIGDDEVRDYILWSHDGCHQAYQRDKAELLPGQLCEVTFEQLIDDPMATLERIYAELDLDDFEAVAPRMSAYLHTHHLAFQPPYPMRGDDIELVNERLGRWLTTWGYERRLPELDTAVA